MATSASGNTKIWVGGDLSNPTTFDDDNNWVDESGASTVTPVSGDDVIFDYHPNGSAVTYHCDTNINQNSKDWNSLTIGPGFKGKLGVSAAAPFKFAATDVKIDRGAGEVWINCDHASLPIVNLDIAGIGENGNGNISVAGTITNLSISKGRLTQQSGTITTMYLDAESTANDVIYENVSGTVTTLHQILAKSEMSSAGTFTTFNMGAGSALIRKGTVTTMNMRHEAGTVTWNSTTTMTTANVERGTLDVSQTALARTITTLNLFKRGTFINTHPANNVTVTNSYVFNGKVLKPARTAV